ncbi:flagellar hook-basal body complex protein FliE [Desulfovibrio sp. OttesenSCG-928-M14]|nr:flagellar hook-basal body complex protein FliE [Desulfovibrio sp. OttesenSCG-928-M14]
MSIQSVGLKAYTNALQNFAKAEKATKSQGLGKTEKMAPEFSDVLASSLEKVNDLQSQRSSMISSFASGETQNVHELMIAMQKAGLAMNMTSAVRNKVIEAYKELSRMQF